MKNKWLTLAVAAAAVFSMAGVANAVPVSGDITFAGGVALNTDSAGTATEVTGWTGTGGTGSPVVISSDGSFSGLAGSAATFTAPWFFNSGAVPALWSVGGFTFNLASSSIVFQGGHPAGVLVDGTGTVVAAGFTPTSIDWSFSVSDPSASTTFGAIFSFQSANGTTGGSVPDGGTTAMLLGMGILGLGLLKKLMVA
ncbi:MAG TPA: VPDSG-CTERM sorting domain-containing protein [Verrucomicrobiae bacterium]